MKKNGFISISVVYSFFFIFLLLLLFIVDSLISNRILLSNLKNDVKNSIAIKNICKPGINLTDCVRSQYSEQGINNLYHHDGTILATEANANTGVNVGDVIDANDGSYRYAGSYETTNNWVCFGSNETKCPEDNLYRIIGVFNEKIVNADGTDSGNTEERVKLIMNDYAGQSVLGKAQDGTTTPYSSFTGVAKPSGAVPAYAWSGSTSVNSNDWLTSTFNTNNLNGTYLTKLGNEWSKKIALTEWKVGGNTSSNIYYNVKTATTYQNEIVSPAKSTTDTKKVGLMYASDYGFAASPANWTTNLGSYSNDTNRNNNWLYRGVYEWTISPYSSDSHSVFNVNFYGYLDHANVFGGFSVRPSLYLEASVTYASGEGTEANPIRIN